MHAQNHFSFSKEVDITHLHGILKYEMNDYGFQGFKRTYNIYISIEVFSLVKKRNKMEYALT